MNFNRLLNTPVGQAFVSFILGIGIATLFRTVCKDGDCVSFNGPILSELDENFIFKHDDSCYKYKKHSSTCMSNKKTVPIDSNGNPEPKSESLTKTSSPMSLFQK
jgi:hypothetical protein